MVPHLPVLRGGVPYRSKDFVTLRHISSGEPLAEVSQANRGLIAKDLAAAREARRALERRSLRELLSICRRAAELFATAELPVDPLDGVRQSPEDYIRQLSGTTGMPEALCRANMEKVRFVLAEMERVLGGLTRGMDLAVLDSGWQERQGRMLSFRVETDVLGAVLPSNSPGVHSLWLPAIPLKVPLALKPGREEPWTPLRVAQALLEAGCPPEALGYYPTDRSGATEILLRAGRSMLFGDAATVAPWRQDERVQLHGPGWSKVIFGADLAPRWPEHLELIVNSVADNGGRSCLNASGVWTPAHGRELAEALAAELVKIEARSLSDPAAGLAAFADKQVAVRVAQYIEQRLETPGAVDLTARLRGRGPAVEKDGLGFLLPTVIWCEDPEHPLAHSEFLFPFVSVVETPQDEILTRIGPTLVTTAVTGDERFVRQVMASPNVERLNLGGFPTSRISWDQPHEGNLFEHLYRQRAIQVEPATRPLTVSRDA